MAHNSSPYIDGGRGQVYRTVNGTGTIIDPHTNVIAPHNDFIFGVGSKSLNIEPSRSFLVSKTFTINVGTNILDDTAFDCSRLRLLSMRVNNTTTVLTDFIIVVGIDRVAGWDDLANSDYHYTTGQGENTGNSMVLVRKCSPINPRSLSSGASTWLILNVEPYQYIYIRVVASAAGQLSFNNYGVML